MKKETIVKFYADFKLFIFPAVVSVSSLFLIVFAIYPQTVKLIESQKDASNLISKSEFLETKVAALESIDETDLSQKVDYALSSLPAEKDFGRIFDLLQKISSGAGFSVTAISVGSSGSNVKSSGGYEIKLEARGMKALLPVLLKNLENSPRLIRISSIDVASRPAAEGADVSLAISVLYAPIPQSFGSADSPIPQLSQEDELLLAKLAAGKSPEAPVSAQTVRGKLNPFE